jgi:hypothetical protein
MRFKEDRARKNIDKTEVIFAVAYHKLCLQQCSILNHDSFSRDQIVHSSYKNLFLQCKILSLECRILSLAPCWP